MLSYRHSFHAGNFADVLKHLVLVQCLNHLVLKDKPLVYIDTHAGAGGYSLASSRAQMHREYAQGIGRLWARSNLPAALADYVGQVRSFNKQDELRGYPGSPWFARRLLRPQDRLELFELHPGDFAQLQAHFRATRRIRLHAQDGFRGCIGLLPPIERRGLLLLDPAYEVKGDYQEVINCLSQAHRRFETGVIVVWYPVVERQRIDRMQRALKATGIRDVQQYELGVRAEEQPGMGACGLLVVNPPWTLFATMQATLPYLAEVLGKPGKGHYRTAVLVEE